MNTKQNSLILVKNFNETVLTLVNFIIDTSDDFYIKSLLPLINLLVKKNSTKIIDIYILNIMEYQDYIYSDDEDIGNKFYCGEIFKTNNKLLSLFNFKSIWSKLNDDNKMSVKLHMRLLCKIANKYLLLQ